MTATVETAPVGVCGNSPLTTPGWLAGAPGAGTDPVPAKGTASEPRVTVTTSGEVLTTLGVVPPEGTLPGSLVSTYNGLDEGPYPSRPGLPGMGTRGARGDGAPVAWSRWGGSCHRIFRTDFYMFPRSPRRDVIAARGEVTGRWSYAVGVASLL